MAKKTPASSNDRDPELAERIGELTAEVRVLRDSVDELTTALEWALRNGRIEFTQVDATAPGRTTTIELFESGDAVEFEQDGRMHFGEVVDVNDAFNTATVQLIPSLRTKEVKQNDLTRLKGDPLTHRDDECGETSTDTPSSPKPGLLF